MNYTVTSLTNNLTGCAGTPGASDSVTVNPPVSAGVTTSVSNSQVCPLASFTASVPPSLGASYTWTVTGGTITGSSNGDATSGSPSTSASITIQADDQPTSSVIINVDVANGGCTASDSATVDLVDDPAVVSAPANQTSCDGSTVTYTYDVQSDDLNNPSGTTFLWRQDGTNIEPSMGAGSSSGNLTTGAAYTITNTDNGGGSWTSELVLTGVTPSDNATFRAVAIDACNSGTAPAVRTARDATLTVNPLPYAEVSFNDGSFTKTVCDNTAVTLKASISGGAGSFTEMRWYEDDGVNPPVDLGSPLTGVFPPGSYTRTVTPSGVSTGARTRTYFVVLTDANGCAFTSTLNAVASINVPTATMTGGSFCPDATAQLTFALDPTPGADTSNWSVTVNDGSTNTTFGPFAASPAVVTAPNSGTPGTVTYSIVSVTSGSCTNTYAGPSDAVTVFDAPDATADNLTICQNDVNMTLTFNLVAGDSTSWSVGFTDGVNNYSTGPLAGSPATYTMAAVDADTTFTITSVTDNNGCTVASDGSTFTVTVNDPDPTLTLTTNGVDPIPNMEICPASSFVASVPDQSASSATYNWTVVGGSVTAGAGTNSVTITHDGSSASVDVSVDVTIGSCTESSGVTSVDVTDPTLAHVPNLTVCPLLPVTIGGSTSGGDDNSAPLGFGWEWRPTPGSGAWTPLADGVHPGDGSVTVSGATTLSLGLSQATPGVGGDYRLTVTDACGNLDRNRGTLTVLPLPDGTLEVGQDPSYGASTSVCSDGSTVDFRFNVSAGSQPYVAKLYEALDPNTPFDPNAPEAGSVSSTSTTFFFYNIVPTSNPGPADVTRQYYVVLTDSSGCMSAPVGPVDVVVNPLPTVSVAGNTVCDGEDGTLPSL